MITPDWLSYELDAMAVMNELEESIIADIARRIVSMGEVTGSSVWQAEMLQQSGVLYEEIIKEVARKTGKLEAEIRQLFDDAETEIFNYDPVSLQKVGINVQEFKKFSPAMVQIWKAALSKSVTDAKTLTKSVALTSQSTFHAACDLASMQVSSGAFSYNQAIVNAVKAAADTGARVMYPNGQTYPLDAAIRRSVLTSVNQTAGRVMVMQAERFGEDLMEISAHTGARPSHSVWQGHIVSLSGNTNGGEYLTLEDIGYGDAGGFQGVNCRHTLWIYFEGISKPLYTAKELSEMANKTVTYNGEEYSEYEAAQKVRKVERDIRKVKRELVGLNASIEAAKGEEILQAAKTQFAADSVKLKRLEDKLSDICFQTGIKSYSSRTRVVAAWDKDNKLIGGFDRSISQKSVNINEKELAKYTKRLYNKDGTMYVTDNWNHKKHPKIEKEYMPYAVIETKEVKGDHVQFNRTIYDENGKMSYQIHTGHHGNHKTHPYGENGEHKHHFIENEHGKLMKLGTEELNEFDRKEHKDIL